MAEERTDIRAVLGATLLIAVVELHPVILETLEIAEALDREEALVIVDLAVIDPSREPPLDLIAGALFTRPTDCRELPVLEPAV